MLAKASIFLLLPLLLSACVTGSKDILKRQCLTNTHKAETYRLTRYVAGGMSEDDVPLILKSTLLLVLPAVAIGDTLILPVTLWNDTTYAGQCLGWKMGMGSSDESFKCQNWPKGIPIPPPPETPNGEVTSEALPRCD